MISVNNKMLVEAYTGKREIKSEIKGGFASIVQRSKLVGLKLIADAKVFYDGNEIELKKGQVAYFEEEMLVTQK